MEAKTMKDMQKEVDAYIGQFKEGYFSPLAMMARLTEEMGELAREGNHYYGEKPKKTTETERSIEE
ncbi:nucleotide pyrophosphohydrolase, partial [Bacillus paranthracis]|nr:nucleotide pyrophosphohydrolase [Bacillus paranthracis]